MVNITSDLAIALGMVRLEDWGVEPYVGGYMDSDRTIHIWRTERFEEPKRSRCVTSIRLHDDNDDCA